MAHDPLKEHYISLKILLGIEGDAELYEVLQAARLEIIDSKYAIIELRAEVKFQQTRWKTLRKFVKDNGL
jgi:hypothetical protein